MRARAVPFLLGYLALLPTAVRGDWVELRDGGKLRGIDLKPVDPGPLAATRATRPATFTLEDGTVVFVDLAEVVSVTRSPPGETVEHEGKQVSLREKVRRLRLETRKQEARDRADVEAWARGGTKAAEARARVEALPEEARRRSFMSTLGRSYVPEARILAARRLGGFRDSRSAAVLSSAAIADRKEDVRETCLATLQEIGDPTTAERFLPLLRSREREVRSRAARALQVFPDDRAVPILIAGLRRTWADFGRSYFYQGTQRSYLRDYNLVSGGTGFSILEVADPDVATVSTGVVLEAKVVRVEIISYVQALRRITGQDFGADAERWAAWWKEREDAER